MDFQHDHLEVLKQCRSQLELPGGSPAPWLAYVSPKSDWRSLPAKKTRRREIFEFVGHCASIHLACASILAWGGMHRLHGKKLFETTDWLKTAERIRAGELDREQAYDQFAELRLRGSTPGMGPAYFTKLIFFLAPRTDRSPAPGYIMDQWTACSVNLLLGNPDAVLTDCSYTWKKGAQRDSSYTVSEFNDGARYELFCSAIEALAKILGLPPSEAELLLLSEGGKKPLTWRSYVKRHRRPAFDSQ